MSDGEGHGGLPPNDDDLSLPKATVAKMITELLPKDVRLGFNTFTDEVEDVLKDHKQQQKDREKKVSKFEQSGLTEEELLRQQEELFAASRAKFQSQQ
ncbi:hypothetical protein EIP86_011253 [Pleurotus ostreatoroseus]|nr:hypothetical protein EIP86_011253 [Pleurotus ostreatoroseus]